jgi:hypothetical protein
MKSKIHEFKNSKIKNMSKKTILLIAVTVNGLLLNAQENNTWRFGVQSGFQGNHAKFVGGMENANARFHQNHFSSNGLSLVARYDINQHWMLTTGMGVSSTGYEFVIAEDYSFTSHAPRFTSVKAKIPTFEIPLMASYKFNPNCKNWRWFVSGGLANVFVNASNIHDEASQSSDGPSTVNYLSTDVTSKSTNVIQARWAVGREKMFKSGSILSVSLIANYGFGEMSHAVVNYTIDGTSYNHEFSNRGNYVGLRVAYFLKPFTNPWSGKSKSSSEPKATDR